MMVSHTSAGQSKRQRIASPNVVNTSNGKKHPSVRYGIHVVSCAGEFAWALLQDIV